MFEFDIASHQHHVLTPGSRTERVLLMRTFRLQTQISADGYMAGPNGEMDWMLADWSDDMVEHLTQLTNSIGCIVLGRKMAEGFIPHWASQPEGEPQFAIDKFNLSRRVVISNSLTESPWENAEVAGGDIAKIINGLKAEEGGDLIAYGGGTLVRSLIEQQLFDELHLFVHPIALGQGMSVFPDSGACQSLRLTKAQLFDCGIAVMVYEPNRS